MTAVARHDVSIALACRTFQISETCYQYSPVAAKKGFVNIHLLVCSDDKNHLKELRRFLKRLDFRAFDDRFDCSEEGPIALGKRFDPSISDDAAALVAGVT